MKYHFTSKENVGKNVGGMRKCQKKPLKKLFFINTCSKFIFKFKDPGNG